MLIQTYGADIIFIKRKTNRTKPTSLNNDVLVPVPIKLIQLHNQVTLYRVKMFADKLIIFATSNEILNLFVPNILLVSTVKIFIPE